MSIMAVMVTKHANIAGDEKKLLLDKLKRIRGRVDGLVRMIDKGRDTQELLMQFSATQEALRVAMKDVIKSYLSERISMGLTSTNEMKRNETYKEVLDTLYKYIK